MTLKEIACENNLTAKETEELDRDLDIYAEVLVAYILKFRLLENEENNR